MEDDMDEQFGEQDGYADVLIERQSVDDTDDSQVRTVPASRRKAFKARTTARSDALEGEAAITARFAALSPRSITAIRSAVRGVHWGRDPHDPLPPDPANWAPYNPRYIAILYLRLNSGWDMTVNHACFTPRVNSPSERLAQVVQILGDKITYDCDFDDSRLRGYGIYKHIYTYPDAGHEQGRDYDSHTFADFNFYNQNELFVFLHDPDIELEDGDLLGFKAAGNGPKPKDFNFAYFNARAVHSAEMSLLLAQEGRMMRVENYATKEDGTLIGNDIRNYSMDIKFRIDAGDAGTITMIIDPDTGNGAGNEP
jgi:hypothetical protein